MSFRRRLQSRSHLLPSGLQHEREQMGTNYAKNGWERLYSSIVLFYVISHSKIPFLYTSHSALLLLGEWGKGGYDWKERELGTGHATNIILQHPAIAQVLIWLLILVFPLVLSWSSHEHPYILNSHEKAISFFLLHSYAKGRCSGIRSQLPKSMSS